MIYPRKLKLNDSIGIVAVSNGANPDKINYSIENLKKIGFNVLETKNTRNSNQFVSTDGNTRAQEFMSLWQDEKIACIISARGGEFLMEMIPYLHSYKNDILKYNTKWVQGFSDTSLLLFYLTTNYNIATIHASNLSEFAMRELDISLKNNLNFLKEESIEFVQNNYEKYQLEEIDDDNQAEYNLTEYVKYKSIGNMKNINFSGRLIGGCIDAITVLLGTNYDNTARFCNQFDEGVIWYIDNYGLDLLELRRKLWQMKEAGWFNNIKGFMFGRSYRHAKIGDFSFEDCIEKSLGDLNVPIIYDVDIGHVPPQLTIINGAFAKVEYNNGKATIIQELK